MSEQNDWTKPSERLRRASEAPMSAFARICLACGHRHQRSVTCGYPENGPHGTAGCKCEQ